MLNSLLFLCFAFIPLSFHFLFYAVQHSNFNLRTQDVGHEHSTHKQRAREREGERVGQAHNSIQFAGLMWHLSTEPTENYRITRTLIESNGQAGDGHGIQLPLHPYSHTNHPPCPPFHPRCVRLAGIKL